MPIPFIEPILSLTIFPKIMDIITFVGFLGVVAGSGVGSIKNGDCDHRGKCYNRDVLETESVPKIDVEQQQAVGPCGDQFYS